MSSHPDVAIIGGGIVGLSSAYFLARAGLSVSVFDRADFGTEASWAGAGILPPGNPERAATPADRLRAIGSVRFPEFSAELKAATGIDNGYRRCGGVEFLQAHEADVIDLWAAEGIEFELLDAKRYAEVEPAVSPVWGIPYHLPGCAQVRNPWHMRALVAACGKVGVKLYPHIEAAGFETSGNRVTGLRVARAANEGADAIPEGVCRAGRFLIAAGAWSADFLDFLAANASPPYESSQFIVWDSEHGTSWVYPVRGQIVLLKTEPSLLRGVVMVGKRYLVPRGDGHVLVGSTEDNPGWFEKGNTAAGVSELLAFARQTVTRLGTAEVVKCWSGLRPGSPDGLPYIGAVPGWENAFVASGHFRAGVQLSIGTAQAITELLTGQPTCVPQAAFALNRLPEVNLKQAFRS
jgi:glycine oxidase